MAEHLADKPNRDLEDRLRAEHGPIVLTAWGDWKDGVPKGQVLVQLANDKLYFVASEDYARPVRVKTIMEYPSAQEVSVSAHGTYYATQEKTQ
jgi:hypothetical protein